MKMIKVVSKSGVEITIPIKNILLLEKDDCNYYVYLPMKYIEVGKNQFNAIVQFMEDNDNE